MENHFRKENRIGSRHETESWSGAFPEMSYDMDGFSNGKINLLMVILGNTELVEIWARLNSKKIGGNLEMSRRACMRA